MNIERKNIDEVNAIITLHVEKSDYQEKVEKTLKDYATEAGSVIWFGVSTDADKVKDMLPENTIHISISQYGDGRRVVVQN